MKNNKTYLFLLPLLLWNITSSPDVDLTIRGADFSFSLNGKKVSALQKTVKNIAETVKITGIISTITAGAALLKKTYQNLTKSEKKLIKKCLMIFVALWIVSTHVFWVCLYAIGKFVYQFKDPAFRQRFADSVQKMAQSISATMTIH